MRAGCSGCGTVCSLSHLCTFHLLKHFGLLLHAVDLALAHLHALCGLCQLGEVKPPAPLEDLLRRQVRNHGRCRLLPAALDSAALGGRKRVDLGRLAIGGRRVGGAKGHDGRRLHRQRSVGMGVPMKRSLRTARAFPTEIRQNLAQISLRDVATLSGNHRRDDAQGKVLRT